MSLINLATIRYQIPYHDLLSTIGLLTPAFMTHFRRHAVVAIFIISSFITPPDPVLYQYTIAVSYIDKAASKGLLHKNTAGRRKSKITRHLNSLN